MKTKPSNSWVQLPVSQDIWLLRYHQPSSRNAFSYESIHELDRISREAVSQNVRVLAVISGRPWTLPFSSGGQLNDFAQKSRKEALAIHARIKKRVTALGQRAHVLEYYVGGDVFGGGWEFLTTADLILGWSEARIHFNQPRWGIGPGWGGGGRLFRKTKAAGRLLRAQECHFSELARDLPDGGILPRSYFENDTMLTAWLRTRWDFASRMPLAAWRDLVRALRSGHAQAELSAFQKSWATGFHLKALEEWKLRRRMTS